MDLSLADDCMVKLREYVQSMGGQLEGEWRCRARTRDSGSRVGSIDTWFYAPDGALYRSKVAVARGLGLQGNPASGGAAVPAGGSTVAGAGDAAMAAGTGGPAAVAQARSRERQKENKKVQDGYGKGAAQQQQAPRSRKPAKLHEAKGGWGTASAPWSDKLTVRDIAELLMSMPESEDLEGRYQGRLTWKGHSNVRNPAIAVALTILAERSREAARGRQGGREPHAMPSSSTAAGRAASLPVGQGAGPSLRQQLDQPVAVPVGWSRGGSQSGAAGDTQVVMTFQFPAGSLPPSLTAPVRPAVLAAECAGRVAAELACQAGDAERPVRLALRVEQRGQPARNQDRAVPPHGPPVAVLSVPVFAEGGPHVPHEFRGGQMQPEAEEQTAFGDARDSAAGGGHGLAPGAPGQGAIKEESIKEEEGDFDPMDINDGVEDESAVDALLGIQQAPAPSALALSGGGGDASPSPLRAPRLSETLRGETQGEVEPVLLERLRRYVKELGSELPKGWEVKASVSKSGVSAGGVDACYYGPDGQRCKSMVNVAKQLGLGVGPLPPFSGGGGGPSSSSRPSSAGGVQIQRGLGSGGVEGGSGGGFGRAPLASAGDKQALLGQLSAARAAPAAAVALGGSGHFNAEAPQVPPSPPPAFQHPAYLSPATGNQASQHSYNHYQHSQRQAAPQAAATHPLSTIQLAKQQVLLLPAISSGQTLTASAALTNVVPPSTALGHVALPSATVYHGTPSGTAVPHTVPLNTVSQPAGTAAAAGIAGSGGCAARGQPTGKVAALVRKRVEHLLRATAAQRGAGRAGADIAAQAVLQPQPQPESLTAGSVETQKATQPWVGPSPPQAAGLVAAPVSCGQRTRQAQPSPPPGATLPQVYREPPPSLPPLRIGSSLHRVGVEPHQPLPLPQQQLAGRKRPLGVAPAPGGPSDSDWSSDSADAGSTSCGPSGNGTPHREGWEAVNAPGEEGGGGCLRGG